MFFKFHRLVPMLADFRAGMHPGHPQTHAGGTQIHTGMRRTSIFHLSELHDLDLQLRI